MSNLKHTLTSYQPQPIYAIIVTFLIAQVTMFADINQIASFITMTVRLLSRLLALA
jgi:hypothetical protein